MNFIEYIFILFVFILILAYFVTPQKYRWVVLLASSILFFCTWGIEFLPFVFWSTGVAWIVASVIEKWYTDLANELGVKVSLSQKEKNILQGKVKNRCKYLLWLGVALVLGILVYTKSQRYLVRLPYLDTIVSGFTGLYRAIAKVCLEIPVIEKFVQYRDVLSDSAEYAFFVPLGVSYYTMSLISYMADVYWKKDSAESNYFKVLLFTLYFPKILQGPISKHRNIKSKLYDGDRYDYKRMCFGLQRMLWGYFKKLVIADRLALFVSPVFENYEPYGGGILLLAAVLSALQLYCDFSGCMDIALGISEIFGVKLEENFKRPFFAKTAAEFWKRWHISLNNWFKDYIYMPIVISPKIIQISSKISKCFGKRLAKSFVSAVPIASVWMITGLWHGTGLNYIVWGLYWGLLMIISAVCEPEIKKIGKVLHINVESRGFQVFRRLRTFLLFVVGRIITTPAEVKITKVILERIFTKFAPWQLVDGTVLAIGLDGINFLVAVIALFLVFYVDLRQEQSIVLREQIGNYPIVWRWIIYLLAIFGVLIFGVYGAGYSASSFVYMNY